MMEKDFGRVKEMGLTWFIDTGLCRAIAVENGQEAVYPHFDESKALLNMVSALGIPFDAVIDCFAGGGHSLLPIISCGWALYGVGLDTNYRAVTLAQYNTVVNSLEEAANFCQHDSMVSILRPEEVTGRILFIANPPFALLCQGSPLPSMRDGGVNGLEKTEGFLRNVAKVAKPGDVIIGLNYSRVVLYDDGNIIRNELAEMIRECVPNGRCVLKHLPVAMWREPDGVKRQISPMSLDKMPFKGKDDASKAAYQEAANFHKSQGWTHLAYYSYQIHF